MKIEKTVLVKLEIEKIQRYKNCELPLHINKNVKRPRILNVQTEYFYINKNI